MSDATTTPPTKAKDPRYVPGVSAFDDDMTDAEWFEVMGAPLPHEIPWTEIGTIDLHAGDVGGDYQETDAASRRFRKELPDGTFLTMDVYAYVSNEYHQRGMSREEKVWEVQEATFLMHHTIEDAPGDSEIDTQIEYRYPFDTAGLTKRATLVQARNYIRSLDPTRL